MAGVLSGLKVLDLSKGIAGPMTTMLMGDHGAEVTRITPPGGDRFSIQNGYRVWNRGKRSEEIDLKSEAGRSRLNALAGEADVLVESFAPGVTARLGIDYHALAAFNPRLIYCSITAYGRDNPHSHRPGYDALVAARTGLQWEQRGWPEGAEFHIRREEGFASDVEIPGDWLQGPKRSGPVFSASRWPSLGAFYAALLGVSAALRVRGLTGRGQLVETSLMRGAFAAAWGVWQRAEHPHASNYATWVMCSRSPKGHFLTADGKWIHQWVPNPRFIIESSETGPNPELNVRRDPARMGMAMREIIVLAHFYETMTEHVERHDAEFWLEAGRIAAMPLQICRPVEEALNDPLMLADGCVRGRVDPELGPIREVGRVYRLSACDPDTPAANTGAVTPSKESAAAPRRPLEGVRVLDFGMAIAGPYGTQLLSDLGAEVIKIGTLTDDYFHSTAIGVTCNRGKRSIQIDLKSPRAIEVIHRMVAQSDIVQHNMRYRAAVRLGIDYESLKRIKPNIVYCHTRGHERGPREEMAGNDQTGAALAGTQYEDGAVAAGGRPMWSHTSFGDIGNGFLSAIAMVQALMHRDRTGEGQFVDTAIVNASLLTMSHTFAFPDGSGPPRLRLDRDQLGLCALYRLYPAREGWICIVAMTQKEWEGLCKALDLPDLATDLRFRDATARAANDAELSVILSERLATRDAKNWIEALDSAGVPAEISDPEFSLNMFDDPLLRERGWTVGFEHERLGWFEQAGVCVDLSETPGRVQGPPLIAGADSRAVLVDFGCSESEIDQLIAEGIVRAA
jgi:crotonobetainyl-CoA:carnitine CoA-transferase CaiB-like acyl-CoA transferase